MEPLPFLAALPATTPFIGPERLAREAGVELSTVLRLGANESAFGPAPAVLATIEEELSRINSYGDPDNWLLRELLAERHATDPRRVLVASGIDDLLGLCARAVIAPGDVALMTAGSYPTFAFHVAGLGGRLETVPYQNYACDLPELAAAARRLHPKIVYLANPDNPSGSFAGASALHEFFAAIPPTSLILLDEAYAEFVEDELIVEVPPNVVRLRSFSKVYGLAGLRVGYALLEIALAEHLEKIRLHFGVNRLAQVAAAAALSRSAFVASVIAQTALGREDYARFAAELGLSVHPSATNFVLFELGDQSRAERLLAELFLRRIFVRKPARGPLASCVRITVGSVAQRQRLRNALAEALAAADAGGART